MCARPLIAQEAQQPTVLNANTTERKMPVRQVLGLVGSLILFIGVFTPVISLPIVGSVNYFQNGRGDGVFILLLAVLSVFLTLTRRYHLLLFTGIGSLAILTITFVTFQMRMSEMQSQFKQTMANNPFAGLGDAMFSTIQIQWGWAVLLIGAVIVTSTALLKETPEGLALDREEATYYFQQSRINILLILIACALASFIIYQLF
jgi:hypothetical protein